MKIWKSYPEGAVKKVICQIDIGSIVRAPLSKGTISSFSHALFPSARSRRLVSSEIVIAMRRVSCGPRSQLKRDAEFRNPSGAWEQTKGPPRDHLWPCISHGQKGDLISRRPLAWGHRLLILNQYRSATLGGSNLNINSETTMNVVGSYPEVGSCPLSSKGRNTTYQSRRWRNYFPLHKGQMLDPFLGKVNGSMKIN